MITHGGPEIVLFLVIFFTAIFYKRIFEKIAKKERIIYITFLWFFFAAISYADVFFISMEARKLCREEAGLHVYKTVEANGFLGSAAGIEHWTEYGFDYVEGVYKGNKTRSTFIDGKVVREIIPEYTSRYQVKTKTEKLNSHFVKGKTMIVDRQKNEILGDLVSFKIYPGWLDSRLLGLLGFAYSPARCDGDYPPERGKRTIYPRVLIQEVIKAEGSNKRDEAR